MADVYVSLKGGMGNQMFQFAAAFAKAKEFNMALKIDLSYLESNTIETQSFTPRQFQLDAFKNTLKYKKYQFQKNGLKREINNYNFQKKFFLERLIGHDFYLDDYFQSESYFDKFKHEILELFTFDINSFSDLVKSYLFQIKSQNLVSIHIRRGDYLKPQMKSTHGLCGIEYYLEAVEFFKQKTNNPKFILFSDEPEKAELELKPFLTDFITYKGDIAKNDSVEMYLMSQCSGNIIANSTFSWWGAYLNNNPGKIVIAPKKWYVDETLHQASDLIPKSWIEI